MTAVNGENLAVPFVEDFEELTWARDLLIGLQRETGRKSNKITRALSTWQDSPDLGNDLGFLFEVNIGERGQDDLTPAEFEMLRIAAGAMWKEGVNAHLRRPLDSASAAFEKKYGLPQEREAGMAAGAFVVARRVGHDNASRMRYKPDTAYRGPKLTRRQPEVVQGLLVDYNLHDETITLEQLNKNLERDQTPQFIYRVPLLIDTVQIESVTFLPAA